MCGSAHYLVLWLARSIHEGGWGGGGCSAVVCIESVPAYPGVVVRDYYSWCMSGSLAGQFRLWYALRVYQLMLGW